MRGWRKFVHYCNTHGYVLGWAWGKTSAGCLLDKADSLHLADEVVSTVLVGIIVGFLDLIAAWSGSFILDLLLFICESSLPSIDKCFWWALLLICSLKINKIVIHTVLTVHRINQIQWSPI